MKAFCMAVHVSVIEDFKTACPYIDVTDWCMSGHHWVMKRKKDVPKIINHETWTSIDEASIARFQWEYGAFLRQFDLFIVAHPSVFVRIFEPFGKPILMLNTVRYDLPYCWTKNLRELDLYKRCLHRLSAAGRLLVVSNNRADQLYLKKGCGLDSAFIPSLCLYTKARYTPTKPQFLLYHGDLPDHPLVARKASGHDWSDITSYRGLISFPYEISLMSLFEYFTAGMPMFLPSRAYWKANPQIQSMSAYWGDEVPPELEELRDLSTWIELSDIYHTFQSPNTVYFDSIPHLFEQLETFTYTPEGAFRESYRHQILDAWRNLLRPLLSRPSVFRL